MAEPQTLAQRIRAKYPGAYDDIPDADLEAKITAKYPGAYDDIPKSAAPKTPAPAPAADQPLAGGPVIPVATDLLTGAAKGVGNTVLGLGRMVKSGFGLGQLSPEDEAAFKPSTWGLEPKNAAENVGRIGEQAAELFLVPGPGKVKGAAKALGLIRQGVGSALLANAQGANSAETVTTGILGGLPVAEGVTAAGKWIGTKAEPLVRAAIKPTVSALRRISGAGPGLDAKAAQLIGFIIDNRLMTAEQARGVVTSAEQELQRVLAVKNAPTDAPTRALRYLGALEKSAAKQGLAAKDVAMIRGAAEEMLQGTMGETVLVQDAAGNWVAKQLPRQDVTAAEALDSARASSRWSTRKAWGEQRGAEMEAAKAVERAQRDAVKAAVPEAAPLLRREQQGIQAAEVLDRMAQRTANRDVIGLPAWAAAGAAAATGHLKGATLVATVAEMMRNGQLRAGIYADRLAKAVERGNAPEVAFYLQKLGIGASLAARANAGQ